MVEISSLNFVSSWGNWLSSPKPSSATAFLTPAPDPSLLKGLVYEGASAKDPSEVSLKWYNTPVFYGIVVLLIFAALNFYFF